MSRSILGLMLGMDELTQDALILLPIVSDSTRKLAYLLRREGLKVHTLDIPPVKNEPALFKYERQLELCVEAISAHTGKHLTRRSLRNAASLVAQAHDEIRRFLRLTEERPTLLSAPWRMLACFSYYCAGDLPKWTELLARLNDKIGASHTCVPGIPGTDALRLTFCGRDIYKSSRKAFISKYAPKTSAREEEQSHGK